MMLKNNLQLLIVFYYLGGIIIGTFLLYITQSPDSSLNLLRLFFTTTSAITLTGLHFGVENFNHYQHLILLLLIEFGGLGITTFSALFVFLLKKKISFNERQLISNQFGQDQNAIFVVIKVILYVLLAQLLGSIMLAFTLIPQFGIKEGVFQAVFHSISTFNSAGFTLLQSPNLYTKIILMILAIIGSIGFLIQYNIFSFLKNKRKNPLNTYAKMNLYYTFYIFLWGTIILFLIEKKPLFDIIFLNSMARTTGITFSELNLSVAGILVLMTLMFIGGCNGSTAGGIKVSTFATLLRSTFTNNKKGLILFEREIDQYNVIRSATILTLYSSITILALTIMLISNPKIDFLELLFECISAITSAGFSLGATQKVNDFGLIILSFLMFFGKIGPIGFLIAFSNKTERNLKYPKEKDILVG